MSDDRTKRYEKAGIDRDRYFELRAVCRQYDTMRKMIEVARMANTYNDALEHKWHKICAINESVEAVCKKDSGMAPYILRAVTKKETYEQINPPCGRNQFYRRRRAFFVELDKRL